MSVASKIRIKLGDIEVEYEGSDAFIKGELQELLEKMSTFQPASKPGAAAPKSSDGAKHVGTTATLASRLGDSSGTGLVLAACGHLTLVKGMDRFERQKILDEMKAATGYYKKTFNNNLTSYLGRLVKNKKLLELSKGEFCLTADARRELEMSFNS